MRADSCLGSATWTEHEMATLHNFKLGSFFQWTQTHTTPSESAHLTGVLPGPTPINLICRD